MISIGCFLVPIVFTCALAGVIPVPNEDAANDLLKDVVPVHTHKTVTSVIAELKVLEILRHNALKNAQDNPELGGNPEMARYLATLVEYDKRWFVYAVRLLDTLDILNHPSGKSPDELQQATDLILSFKQNQGEIQRSISEIKARVDEEKALVPDELLETDPIDAVTTAFQLTYLKLFEAFKMMEAQKSQLESPYSRNYICPQLFRLLYTAPVVSAEVSPNTGRKSVDELLSELKVLEEGRQEALKNATENPKFKADPDMVEFLTVLSLVDSLFVQFHNYYDAINTLIRSDEKSIAAYEALVTIKLSRQQSMKLAKAIQAKGVKLRSPGISIDKDLNFLQLVFESTLQKNEEIEAQLRIAFYSSPYTKYMKDMPDMPDMSET